MWLSLLCYMIMTFVTTIFVILTVMILIGLRYKLTSRKCTSRARLEGKTVLVTGGTAGIGLETAKDLARKGAKVIIACPFEEEGNNAQSYLIKTTGNMNIEFKLLNLASLSSVREFAIDILKTEQRLDILVNNAGVIHPDITTSDGFNFIMQVNYYGLFLLTLLLLPLLKRTGNVSEPSRIVNLASMSYVKGTVDFENINKTGYYSFPGKVYFNSKLCVVLFTRELSKRLSNSNVVVNAADPTVVATQIANNYRILRILSHILVYFYPNAKDGAQSSLHAALDEEAGRVSGEYYYNCRRKPIAPVACDDHLSQLLWDDTLELLKLSQEHVDQI